MAIPTLSLACVILGVMVSGAACLRAPIGDDELHEGADGDGSTDGASHGDAGEGSTGDETEDDAGETTSGLCHPSYDPCLPIVDDLNCPDVVALGAAPVTVIGPDDYGLDRDHDGIGCES